MSQDDPACTPTADGLPTPRERREAALAHGAVLLVFFLPLGNVAGPFLVRETAGRRSPFVAAHAEQAVLFQGFVSVFAWGLFLLALLHGWFPGIHIPLLLAAIPPALWGAVRALRGRLFCYPVTGRWIAGPAG